jgi:hypothetical protein
MEVDLTFKERAGEVLLSDRGRPAPLALPVPPLCSRPMSPWLSKVKNLVVPALGDEDVGRSDVSMHDALAVRSVNRVRNLDREG